MHITSTMANLVSIRGSMEGTMYERAGNSSATMPMHIEMTAERRFELEAMPHLGDLTRTASRLMGDRSRADDVVQETYLQAWKSFDRFESGTNCRAWLYKIMFHCIHHYRRKWFRLAVMKPMDDYTEATASYTPPIPEHLTDEDFVAALEKVPGDFRAVILLVDVEEFPYKDAADILGVPIGTVMSRLSRGRKILREHLSGVAGDYGYPTSGKEASA